MYVDGKWKVNLRERLLLLFVKIKKLFIIIIKKKKNQIVHLLSMGQVGGLCHLNYFL
jgi:hypothetical protein